MDASSIAALVVTHAHLDHIGLIPKFVADGFQGKIYATRPTVALAEVMLRDAARIQAEDVKYKRRRHREEGRKGPHPAVPLYTDKDVDQLAAIVCETIGRGGNLVIPVFAVERAQEMMYYFGRLVHQNRIPKVPIFLDSPMASDVTNIFRRFTS